MNTRRHWPDPRTGELIEQSTDPIPGPFRDEYFAASHRGASGGTSIAAADHPKPLKGQTAVYESTASRGRGNWNGLPFREGES